MRTDLDLLDEVWTGRPGLPDAPVYEHQRPYADKTRAANQAALRADKVRRGATHHRN